MLFLHGFPQFWWAWRHQMEPVSAAGFRACAVDLRGFGASDKPPGGYDAWTACADVSGVIRTLGAESAVVVGHGMGGHIAWSLPYLSPGVVWAVATVGMPHPLAFRRAALRTVTRPRVGTYLSTLRAGSVPEKELATDPETVHRLLSEWAAAGSGWPSVEESARYADAMTIPFAAHSAGEYQRWLVRSQFRREGWRFARRVSGRLDLPVLQIRGDQDTTIGAEGAGASVAHVGSEFTTTVIPGAGHFPHEETPERLNRHLLTWLDGLT